MATHTRILAWRIRWTEEPGGLQSMRLQRVRHDWVTNTATTNRAYRTWETSSSIFGLLPWMAVFWGTTLLFSTVVVWMSTILCVCVYVCFSLKRKKILIYALTWMNLEGISEVAQSCPTVCDPMECSLWGSSVHGIFRARILEWVAISFSRGSSQPRDRTQVSHIVGRRFTIWATREVQWNKPVTKRHIL